MNKFISFFLRDSFIRCVLSFCAIICTIPIFLIFAFIIYQAWPALRDIGVLEFLVGTAWKPTETPPHFGVFFMITGSIVVTLIAMIFAMAIGLGTSIYLVFFCKPRIAGIINQAVSLLASIPSVVYGFWGIMIVVPMIRNIFGGNGNSVLAASIVLSIIILPTVISLNIAALQAVPRQYLEGALALGSQPEEAIFSIMLRAAKPALVNAFILTLGRAIGETTAVVLVAGNANIFPKLLKPVRTLTANIALEMGYASGLHYNAIVASGAVLFIIVLVLNLSAKNISTRI